MPLKTKTALGVLLLGLLPVVASATVVLSETFEEMAHRADAVARVTVGRSQAAWDPQGRRIWTYTEVRPSEVLKGDLATVFLVAQPGGEVGELGQRVAGVAQFTAGEDLVLFLQGIPGEPGVYDVRGLSAGRVKIDSRLTPAKAIREAGDIAVYEGTARPPIRQLKPYEDLGPADQFLAMLREAVTGGGR